MKIESIDDAELIIFKVPCGSTHRVATWQGLENDLCILSGEPLPLLIRHELDLLEAFLDIVQGEMIELYMLRLIVRHIP